ncbi:MAG: response regulator [Nitrospira sp.]
MVVDDSPEFHLLVKAYVAEEHYFILSAADTLQATGTALREKPALVLVDIGLPGGDGWMLLDRLKTNALTRHIPVIVVTGQTKQGLQEKARLKGAIGFLTKPIDKATLLSALAAALGPDKPTAVPSAPPASH